jgi:hypothetical protein
MAFQPTFCDDNHNLVTLTLHFADGEYTRVRDIAAADAISESGAEFGVAYLVGAKSGPSGYLFDPEDGGCISWFGDGERYQTASDAMEAIRIGRNICAEHHKKLATADEAMGVFEENRRNFDAMWEITEFRQFGR